ncbi:MAG: hypothetical protein QM817_21550 [Archangium sp.]
MAVFHTSRLCAAALVLLVASPALAIDVKYGVGARTELRTRTPLPGDQGTGITGDLELDPTLDLALLFDTSALAMQYAPTLIWREPQTGGRLLPLQRGRIGFTQKWSKALLTLTEDGAWGLADIGALRNPDDPSQVGQVNAVQTLGGVPYLRSATSFTLDGQVSNRVSLGGGAGFAVSGSPDDGTGTTNANAMPLQYGPSGSARVRWLATRIDALTTQSTVFFSRFLTGQEQLVSTLTESWDRQLSRTWSISLAGGAALTREVVTATQMQGTPGTYIEILPVGSASSSWGGKFGTQTARLGVSARLAPFADRFTGFVYERLEGRVQGDWKPGRDWAVTAAGSGALAVAIGRAEQQGDRLVSGEAAVTWTARQWLVLQASARVLWTEQPRLGIPGQVQAVGVVSVTVREQDSVGW